MGCAADLHGVVHICLDCDHIALCYDNCQDDDSARSLCVYFCSSVPRHCDMGSLDAKELCFVLNALVLFCIRDDGNRIGESLGHVKLSAGSKR